VQNSGVDIIAKEIWPFTSPKLNPLDYHIWGNVRHLSRALSKTKDYSRTEGNATLGSDRERCEWVFKATECLCCSWGWTLL